MSRTTPQQWLTKWGQNLNGATAAIKSGVANVKTAPGVSAAAQANKMVAGVQAAVASGKWQSRVSSVSLASWQSSMTNKGISNLAAGITQAQANKLASVTKMLADTDAAVASVANMPTDTLQQRIQKAAAYMQARSAAAAQGA